MAERHASSSSSPNTLEFKPDIYGGVAVEASSLPHDPAEFAQLLSHSLSVWTNQKIRGVWLRLPLANSTLVPVAVEAGFTYHHAEPDYLMLTKWLPTDSPSSLPPNASHQVGVGAFVLDSENRLLAVQERNGPLKGKNVWKLPTGLIHQGEDLAVGAVREVLEETGIQTEFHEVITFRHGHFAPFGKSDLFVVCALRPLSFDIEIQEEELEAAQWMPYSDFIEQQFLKDNLMFTEIIRCCLAHAKGEAPGLKGLSIMGRGGVPVTLFVPSPKPDAAMLDPLPPKL